MRNVIALILGGGKGTRLHPLTSVRSKPAVPLAGKYRIIDIPISNCLNCGVNRIYVLTQFNSSSLHIHIGRTYKFDHFGGGFVEILAAQQTNNNTDWYQGTADAVRQNLVVLEESTADYVLILSGDQLYRMDYSEMVETHVKTGADVTIAGIPVDRENARACGILRLDDNGKVVGFLEKPQTDEEINLVRTEPSWIDAHGLKSHGRDCMASMGIYLFNRKTLIDLLTKTDYQDFGKEVFPASIRSRHVQVHLFDGYWEDIGTVRAFFDANLQLTRPDAPFELCSADKPVFSQPRFLPPTLMSGATVTQSLIADGCRIESGAVIENSVIGLRCRIGKNARISNSVIMGADFFETDAAIAEHSVRGLPPVGIGAGAIIEGAIVDKNCRIAAGAKIVNPKGIVDTADGGVVVVRDGVIVVPKDTTVPADWALD
jgi:glucose-1-phosphate adenylyltransferase